MANSGELPTDAFLEDASIRDNLKVIAEKRQVDYLLVAVGEGLVVSADKQVSQAVGSTLASIFITLGNASVTRTTCPSGFVGGTAQFEDWRGGVVQFTAPGG